LHHVRNDQQDREIERRELSELALARYTQRNKQEEINDDTAQNNEQRRCAKREKITY
jgi:hypothetical protein